MKAEILKKLKDESKLTTKQISEKNGIPESTISRILSGQTDNPSFDSIYAIVKAMGGSLDSVFENDIKTNNDDTSPLIKLYEKVISEKNWYIKLLIILCGILILSLILIIIIDVLNGTVGFVRY